jgi:predicted transcriptional regulator
MSYGTDYMDIPELKTRKGGKGYRKMSNKATTVTETPKVSKSKYSKTRGEHFKDIVIAILIVGVIAFIAGVHYSDTKNAQMISAIKSAQTTAVTPQVKK